MKITYNACRDNMGESTDGEYSKYKAAVLVALTEEFPGAEIRVGDSDFSNEDQIQLSQIDIDIDRDAVEDVIRRVSESESWWDAV